MALDPTKAFLGVGWAFPPTLDSNGSVAAAVYEEDIRQAIEIIIFTNRGERVMRPEFGAGLNEFIFENVSTATMALIETRVREALIAWEARIDIKEVTVASDRSERNKLLIDLTYIVRATNSRHNLVFPFYLEEGTPS
jgi:phage baseplate assembly protein W